MFYQTNNKIIVGPLKIHKKNCPKKSRIRETKNLSTDADSSTDIFVSAGVKKGADSNFYAAVAAAQGAF